MAIMYVCMFACLFVCAGRVLVALKGTVPVDYECHQKVGKVMDSI